MKRTTSRSAIALVAVAALAACGGSDDADSSVGAPPVSTTDTTGTVVPPDDGLRAPTPIEVQSGGSPGGGGAEAAPTAAGEIASSDMMIAPWVAEYVVGEGMPSLPTDDTGYVYDAAVAITPERVADLAVALGVEGEPVRIDEGYGVNWRVGPDDGSAASLWVSDDGQQSWNYSAAWGDERAIEACAVSIDAEGNETSDCPEPEPPVGVPTAAEAEQRVREILPAIGVDVGSVSFDSRGDEWSAGVDVSDNTDPRAPVRNWYFGFGAEGVLQYAGGVLATPSPVGPYPLVDLDTAVARLSDGFWGGFGGPAVLEPAIASVSEPLPLDETGEAAADEPAIEEPVEERVIEPGVEPEPVVVTLVDVQADLWWAWDADGVAWLLPGYRFIDTDGGWHTVPAVTDEFLIRAEPVGDPIPVEGDGGIGDGAEPPPESLPADSDETVVVDIEPGTDPEVALTTLEEFVGLSIEEFTAEAEQLGFTTRIVMLDGEPQAVTEDYRLDRVNVVVEGPRVVAIDSIG